MSSHQLYPQRSFTLQQLKSVTMHSETAKPALTEVWFLAGGGGGGGGAKNCRDQKVKV